jgi:hypothetical protein
VPVPAIATAHDDGALPSVPGVPPVCGAPPALAPPLLLELDETPPLDAPLLLAPPSPLDVPPLAAPSRPKNFAAWYVEQIPALRM